MNKVNPISVFEICSQCLEKLVNTNRYKLNWRSLRDQCICFSTFIHQLKYNNNRGLNHCIHRGFIGVHSAAQGVRKRTVKHGKLAECVRNVFARAVECAA